MTTYGPGIALIVCDVQNDFADPAGSLYVPGGHEVVAVVAEEVARAVDSGAFVAYTQDWHPPRTPHFRTDGGPWPVHCVQETWGAAFHPGLRVAGDVVRKGAGAEDGYSGFSVRDARSGEERATALERLLREAGAGDIVVVGLATDYCVKETALDAARLGFRTTVPARAVRAVEVAPGDGARALDAMRRAGVTVA